MEESEPTFGDGRYIVRRELGRGTMGVVYEAEDPVLGRTVAVKTIDLMFAPGAKVRTDFERRFFTEARVAAHLSHPGIVVCHDVGKDAASGRLFIVFEHLRGRTLEERVAQGALPWREALGVIVQVARAIHHAHDHGVVHRDLKPANIMLLDRDASGARAEAAVKIMDFGVARLESLGPRITRTGQAFGSPLYMSPEQALGQPSSARSDIFSLGSVLCTLVLGRPWFEAPNLPKIVDRLAHDDPPRLSRLQPGVPPSLDLVVAKALAKREEDRYRNGSEMAEDLEDVLAGRAARHAFGPGTASRGASDEEALLAGLGAAASGPRRPGPHDPLASLLDDAAAPTPAPIPTAPLASTTPMTVAPPARSRRPWLAPVLVGLAVLAGAFVLAFRARAPQPGPPAIVPTTTPAAPTLVAEKEPEPPVPTTLAPLPEATPAAPPSAAPTVRAARPTATPTLPVVPVTEPPAAEVPAVVEEPVAAPAGARIRLAVTHPFEDGRLIVWIDGVLVHEAKLQASSSRRIVAFKVREGSAQSMLDVTPGPHEVRVEVTWGQGRATRTKVVDVAAGATGLLEAKVGRMSKELSLAWSRLTKE